MKGCPAPSRLPRVEAAIERVTTQGRAIAPSDGSVHDLSPVAVSLAEGEALRRWVRRSGASRTIEVGLGYGVSALFICAGLLETNDAGVEHVVIDPNQWGRFGGCGLQLLDDAGVGDLVEYLPEGSETVLPRLMSEGRGFDFAFVDGNHRFDAVFVDLYYLVRLVRPGGVVVVDDYQLPGIARAVSFWVTNVGWSVEETSTAEPNHHWCVLRTPTGTDTRHFASFVDF